MGQSKVDRRPLFVHCYFWRFMKGGGKKEILCDRKCLCIDFNGH